MEILTETALEILSFLRLRSAMRYPYAASAFGILECKANPSLLDLFSTDGKALYFSPKLLCLGYQRSPEAVFHA